MITYKPYWLFSLFLLVLLLPSCKNEQEAEVTVTPKAQVEVVNVSTQTMEEEMKLFATSFYLKRNLVTAPVPCFITNVYIRLGDRVKKGQVLYELETKERRALGNQNLSGDTTLTGFGKIAVKAPSSGIISTLDKQQIGDYVLEGNPLCTIAESENLAFQLNVPYEYTQTVKQNTFCTIILPDATELKARITTPLSNMNVLAQTQPYLVRPLSYVFLPENLITSVKIVVKKKIDTQVLPKNCVLSDEVLKHFWVMKLINDSTAVKVPVVTGIINENLIEIDSPMFQSDNRIVSVGNYGLADTTLVRVLNKK